MERKSHIIDEFFIIENFNDKLQCYKYKYLIMKIFIFDF